MAHPKSSCRRMASSIRERKKLSVFLKKEPSFCKWLWNQIIFAYNLGDRRRGEAFICVSPLPPPLQS